jgi:hypothetical protein
MMVEDREMRFWFVFGVVWILGSLIAALLVERFAP